MDSSYGGVVILGLVIVYGPMLGAWLYLYRKGAEARDLIFWGMLSLLIPILGPLAVFAFFRGGKHKR